MSENWVTALDGLAAGGVIDFDAPAYLLNQPARYVGHPQLAELPMTNISLLPEGTKIKPLPKKDEFQHSNGNLVQNPKWKKVLAGIVVAGGVVATAIGILAHRGKIDLSKFKSKIKMPKMSGLKSAGKTVLDYIKKPFQFIASKFKKP